MMKLNFLNLFTSLAALFALTACDVPIVPFVDQEVPANSIMGNPDVPNSALLAFFNEKKRRSLAVQPYSDIVKIKAQVDTRDRIQPLSIMESTSTEDRNWKAMDYARNMPFSPIRLPSGNAPKITVYVLFYDDLHQALIYPEQDESSSPVAVYGGKQHLKFVSLD